MTGNETYGFNAANMLLSRSGASYSNDADGNTLTGGGRSMTWDAQNRMVSCTKGAVTSSFTYGADGLRRQMTANGTTTDYVLDNSMFVRERNHATGATIATYLVGARGPEYRRDDVAGTVRWYLYDGLGSVLGEVDPTGAVTSSRKYDVYGAVRGGNNPGGSSRHKFVGSLGHPSDDETGLIYMRARYYDPAVGRFASEDPSCENSNWFLYCADNPVGYVDSSGKNVIDVLFVFLTITFGVVVALELLAYITSRNKQQAIEAQKAAITSLIKRLGALNDQGISYGQLELDFLVGMYSQMKDLELQAQNLDTIIGKQLTVVIWAVLGEAAVILLECAFGTML